MATAKKRLTRKDIRQPDWFQRTSDQALDLFWQHQNKVIAAAVFLLLIVVAMWGFQLFKARQDDQASVEFSQAMNFYQQQKYSEAIPLFEKVEAFRWSRYALLAHLYRTNSYMALNDLDKAISSGQRFVSATRPDTLYRQIGLVTVADAEERKGQCPQALPHYAEAASIAGALKERALLGKARCATRTGDNKIALEAYKEYQKINPESGVSAQIADLEAKNTSRIKK